MWAAIVHGNFSACEHNLIFKHLQVSRSCLRSHKWPSKPNLALPEEIPLKASSSSKRIDSSRELVPCLLACFLPSFQSSKQTVQEGKVLETVATQNNSHANSSSD